LSLAAVLLYNHPLKKNIIDSPDSLIRNERKREKEKEKEKGKSKRKIP